MNNLPPILSGIDTKHLHLSEEHYKLLFGDEKPRKLKKVRQPGYFAGWQTVTLVGPRGEIPSARIIFPFREYTQVEITRSDAIKLGNKAPLKKSGDLEGSAPVKLVGPKGTLELEKGCFVPWRHIHMSPAEAELFGVKHNEFVTVSAGKGTGREVIFKNVWIRATPWFVLEYHLDADEANASGIKNNDIVEIIEKNVKIPPEYSFFPEELPTRGVLV
ncbi:PduL/EutD family phosphate acyltransferase [Elusimicrobiota bacterium]